MQEQLAIGGVPCKNRGAFAFIRVSPKSNLLRVACTCRPSPDPTSAVLRRCRAVPRGNWCKCTGQDGGPTEVEDQKLNMYRTGALSWLKRNTIQDPSWNQKRTGASSKLKHLCILWHLSERTKIVSQSGSDDSRHFTGWRPTNRLDHRSQLQTFVGCIRDSGQPLSRLVHFDFWGACDAGDLAYIH